MDEFWKYIIQSLPLAIQGLVIGVVILFLEYRTNWFSKFVPRKTGNPQLEFYTRRQLFDWIETLVQVMFVFSLLGGMIYVFTLGTKTDTSLDNSTDTKTILKTIRKSGSASFFNNGLFISVYDASVPREKTQDCSFTMGAPGFPSQSELMVNVGFSSVLDFGTKYEVRLTSIGVIAFPDVPGCDFTVTKLGSTP